MGPLTLWEKSYFYRVFTYWLCSNLVFTDSAIDRSHLSRGSDWSRWIILAFGVYCSKHIMRSNANKKTKQKKPDQSKKEFHTPACNPGVPARCRPTAAFLRQDYESVNRGWGGVMQNNPSLSLISLLHRCFITTLPPLLAHNIMTWNDLDATLCFFPSSSGRVLKHKLLLITSRLLIVYTYTMYKYIYIQYKLVVFSSCFRNVLLHKREKKPPHHSNHSGVVELRGRNLVHTSVGLLLERRHGDAWAKCVCWWIKVVTSHYCQVVV